MVGHCHALVSCFPTGEESTGPVYERPSSNSVQRQTHAQHVPLGTDVDQGVGGADRDRWAYHDGRVGIESRRLM
jgi:hypothetical protein